MDSFLASLKVTSPAAANCASPPAARLVPSRVRLRPAEMFNEPPVLMLETTASELLSLALSTPTLRLREPSSLSNPADTLTDKELAWNVLRAASMLTLPPAATLVSPATAIWVPSRRVSPRVVMVNPPSELSEPTTALVPELLALDTSVLALALTSVLAPAPAVTSTLRDAATERESLLLSKVSLAALKSRLSAAIWMPPAPALKLVPSNVVLPVVLIRMLPPEMLAATALVDASRLFSLP